MSSSDACQTLKRAVFSVRHSLLRQLFLLVLLTSGAILGVTIVGAYRTVKGLSRSLIELATVETEARLEPFFESVRRNLLVMRDWARAENLDVRDVRAVNALCLPLLEQHPQASSMMIASSQGAEVLLLRDGATWVNREVDVERRGREVRWWRWKDRTQLVEERVEEIDYDPRGRPWYQGAVALSDEQAVSWTEPYTFFTTKEPGITASASWQTEDGVTHVIALDVLLLDLSRFTASLRLSEGSDVFVMTEDGRVVGLPGDPRFETASAMKAALLGATDELGMAGVATAVRRWRKDREATREPFPLTADGQDGWAGFRAFSLGPKQRLWIGVIVPEADFLAGLDAQRNTIGLITLVALGLAVIMAVRMDRRVRGRVAEEVLRAKQLGQYTLEEKIGEGAMGTVYRARHAMLRRPTAIKLLRTDRAGREEALLRFEREVQLTSRLTHPNTVAIYDYGRTPDHVFYYAMEYLPGITLRSLVEAVGALPPGRVIHILLQVCGALEEAHGIGLIHRDIKPANIMLCERGGRCDVVKVLDFGLVKDLGGGDATTSDAAALTGTPLYMSPESIRAPATIDARSDLYAVGAVGYYLLTGTPVFEGEGIMAVCALHLNEPPEPPSQRLGAPVSDDLAHLILACLAKEAADRPRTAADVAEALAGCADAGTWSPVDARTWWSEQGTTLASTSSSGSGSSSSPISATGQTLQINLETRD